VHRIVEHHRGEIEVENTERGALFTIRLPVSAPTPLIHHQKNRKTTLSR
jgi:signal transduction histidine kinase